MRRYAHGGSISDRRGLFVKREGYFVALRAALYLAFGAAAYRWPMTAWLTIPLAICFLADGLLIATAHAFNLAGSPSNALRFVVLNLVSFLSLTPCFALFLLVVRDRFSPGPLGWLNALEVAFVATTGSNALAPPASHYALSSFIIGASTVAALFYVFVVLVVAVSYAQRLRDPA